MEKLDVELVARMGESGTGGVSPPIAHIPVHAQFTFDGSGGGFNATAGIACGTAHV